MRILVVDDEPLARERITRLLSGRPPVKEVIEAPDGPRRFQTRTGIGNVTGEVLQIHPFGRRHRQVLVSVPPKSEQQAGEARGTIGRGTVARLRLYRVASIAEQDLESLKGASRARRTRRPNRQNYPVIGGFFRDLLEICRWQKRGDWAAVPRLRAPESRPRRPPGAIASVI